MQFQPAVSILMEICVRHQKQISRQNLLLSAVLEKKQLPKLVIIDGCALLWTVVWPASPAVVSDYVTAVVHAIKQRANKAAIVHVVFDR